MKKKIVLLIILILIVIILLVIGIIKLIPWAFSEQYNSKGISHMLVVTRDNNQSKEYIGKLEGFKIYIEGFNIKETNFRSIDAKNISIKEAIDKKLVSIKDWKKYSWKIKKTKNSEALIYDNYEILIKNKECIIRPINYKKESKNVKISINNKEYDLYLEDNKTTKELIKRLPLSLVMKDLNENEKYIYLDKSLPTNSYNPKNIEKGDVMLYGNDCLVIFYKSFTTSYSYTKIGHINNLEDLKEEDIIVKINN